MCDYLTFVFQLDDTIFRGNSMHVDPQHQQTHLSASDAASAGNRGNHEYIQDGASTYPRVWYLLYAGTHSSFGQSFASCISVPILVKRKTRVHT